MERGHLHRIALVIRHAVSWFVIVLGLLLGTASVGMMDRCPVFEAFDPFQWSRAAFFALLGFVSLIASILAIRSRRQAAILFLGAIPLMFAFTALLAHHAQSGETDSLLKVILVFLAISLPFAIPGVFWLVTWLSEWPPLFPSRRAHAVVGSSLFVFCITAGLLLSLDGPFPDDECPRGGPYTVTQQPGHVAFTAKVIFVGRPIEYPFSEWSLVRVERRFWGLAAWAPGYVIVRYPVKKGETGEYFVDGRWSPGLFKHFLPVVEPYPCCHTEHLDRAQVDLRALRDGPPKSGVRIIGRVYFGMYGDNKPANGVKVQIIGPGGIVSTTTDQQGIYDVVNLPPGHYKIQIESECLRERFAYRGECDLKTGDVWGATLTARPTEPKPAS